MIQRHDVIGPASSHPHNSLPRPTSVCHPEREGDTDAPSQVSAILAHPRHEVALC
jgi:hypothetical protein